jgi:hypothetical protein
VVERQTAAWLERRRHCAGCGKRLRSKGALSQDTARLMVFKLVMAAARTWRRLKGENQLPKVIDGVRFKGGIEVITVGAKDAA